MTLGFISSTADNFFSKPTRHCLGNESEIHFWISSWCGPKLLRNLFLEIYEISVSKEATVGSLCHWLSGSLVWDICLNRDIKYAEKSSQLSYLYQLLEQVHIFPDKANTFKW